jgi:hypothetical protein
MYVINGFLNDLAQRVRGAAGGHAEKLIVPVTPERQTLEPGKSCNAHQQKQEYCRVVTNSNGGKKIWFSAF